MLEKCLFFLTNSSSLSLNKTIINIIVEKTTTAALNVNLTFTKMNFTANLTNNETDEYKAFEETFKKDVSGLQRVLKEDLSLLQITLHLYREGAHKHAQTSLSF